MVLLGIFSYSAGELKSPAELSQAEQSQAYGDFHSSFPMVVLGDRIRGQDYFSGAGITNYRLPQTEKKILLIETNEKILFLHNTKPPDILCLTLKKRKAFLVCQQC